MPIHKISSGDEGFALHQGGGASPLVARHVYTWISGSYVQASQLWRCTNANPITGVYTWVQFAVTDKYAPSIAPAAYSISQLRAGSPVKGNYTDEATTGVNYTLYLYLNNLSVGTGDILIGTLNVGRSSPGSVSYTPTGWTAGDLIDGHAIYEDSNGYPGPTRAAAAQFTYLG